MMSAVTHRCHLLQTMSWADYLFEVQKSHIGGRLYSVSWYRIGLTIYRVAPRLPSQRDTHPLQAPVAKQVE